MGFLIALRMPVHNTKNEEVGHVTKVRRRTYDMSQSSRECETRRQSAKNLKSGE